MSVTLRGITPAGPCSPGLPPLAAGPAAVAVAREPLTPNGSAHGALVELHIRHRVVLPVQRPQAQARGYGGSRHQGIG